MELAVESEWGSIEDIRFDFETLLYIKSPIKLMLCDPQRNRDLLLPLLSERLALYPDHLRGEQYLVLDLKGNPTGGAPNCHVWKAKQDGKAETVVFSPMPGSPFIYRLAAQPEAGP